MAEEGRAPILIASSDQLLEHLRTIGISIHENLRTLAIEWFVMDDGTFKVRLARIRQTFDTTAEVDNREIRVLDTDDIYFDGVKSDRLFDDVAAKFELPLVASYIHLGVYGFRDAPVMKTSQFIPVRRKG